MFRVGDKVVYPGHGVALIESVLQKIVGGNTLKFFKLAFLYKDMTVLVPVDSEGNAIGIRSLSAKKDVDAAINELYKESKKLESIDFTPSSWNKRNKGYQLKIQGGNLIDIASIYRDLMKTSHHKELSFGEKNLLHVAEELLAQEIVIIKNQEKEVVLAELRSPFKHIAFPSASSGGPTAAI